MVYHPNPSERQPIFIDPMENFEPYEYFLYWVTALILGFFGLVNRDWVNEDENLNGEYWDEEYTDPKQHWDGYEYRPDHHIGPMA
jgi:hypothetical protein